MKRTWEIFDSLVERYDGWFERKGRLAFTSELKAIKLLIPVAEQPSLEIGVGTGRFASSLGIRFGVDPSFGMLRKASARGIRVVLGRGEYLPFPSALFRVVTVITTLEFVSDVRAVLDETFRVLGRGGKAVFGFISAESPWGLWYRQRAATGDPFYSNSSLLASKEMLSLIRLAGFVVKHSVSTLRQKHGEVEREESAHEGVDPEAGFIAVLAAKP